MREIDKIVGFELTENFERFDQMNDIFTRAFWDDGVKSRDTEAFFNSYRSGFVAKRAEGFNQKDFALRNASWLISDLISNRGAASGIREGFQAYIQNDTPVANNKITIENEQQQSKEVKRIAKLFGADLVGITSFDERWHYSHRVDTTNFEPVQNELPKDCNKVIVMAHAMDYDLVETYPKRNSAN